MLDIVHFLTIDLFMLIKEAQCLNLPKTNINYMLPSTKKSKYALRFGCPDSQIISFALIHASCHFIG